MVGIRESDPGRPGADRADISYLTPAEEFAETGVSNMNLMMGRGVRWRHKYGSRLLKFVYCPECPPGGTVTAKIILPKIYPRIDFSRYFLSQG